MFTALAVETFALPPQERDRSERGVLDSPTRNRLSDLSEEACVGACPNDYKTLILYYFCSDDQGARY